jgi:mannosylglycerate hydrolase
MRVYNPSATETAAGSVEFTTPLTEWLETLMDETLKVDVAA